jgi:PAT family beta-lactamase induction signal transducer AmpG
MENINKLYRWVPSLYFMEGLPFALITLVVPVFYKTFNLSNTAVAFYTSLFTIPWLCKPLIAPLFEPLASKKTLVLFTQFLLVISLLLLAASLQFNKFFLISGLLLFLIAVTAAIYDMNADGLYIISLNTQEQAYFIGVRTLFYQIGKMLCQGGLVYIAGFLMHYFTKTAAWQIVIVALALIILMLAIYHLFILPATNKTAGVKPVNNNFPLNSVKQVLIEFLTIPYLAHVLIFVLIYNLAEAQLLKIVPLFLLDSIKHGGLAQSIEQVGTLYGGLGTVGMLIGVLLSGFLLAKFTLKRYLVPITIVVGISNISYLLLSLDVTHSVWWLGSAIILAQIGYGLSNGAYMLYLLNTFTRGQYPMSLYAIGTALMGLSMVVGGAVSGYMQDLLGYTGFFSWILLASLCIILVSVYNSKKVL